MISSLVSILLFIAIFLVFTLYAEQKRTEDSQLEEIIVQEKRIVKEKSSVSISPETFPANVSVLSKDEMSNLLITRHEEVFRKIPSLSVENYGQVDIGSALTMRGLGGGGGGKRYVTTYIDGVPQNYPIYFGDHVLSWLIPEIIDRVEVIKGPFSVFCGDNSIGECINITTKEFSPSSIMLSGGSYGSFRFIPVFSHDKLNFIPFIFGEHYRTDGFRDNSD